MHSRILNPRDIEFILYQLLDVESLTKWPRFAEHSRETFDAALATAEKIATEKFAPHNRKADQNEPTFDGGEVKMIPDVAEALREFNGAGFLAATQDFGDNGMQLPWSVAQACLAWFNAANIATAAYPFLTIANGNLIETFGSEQQKARYLGGLRSGRFYGTMCLSETQAGSSLADVRCTAVAQADGSYRLRGSKMWISGGDHPLSENIIHLVLARIEGAPPGVKGISLFIVPKFVVNEDGTPGERNEVALAGLNHKMGYRGTTNCVLNFGEGKGARAELIGEPNRGLACMFHMMNEARIGVGMGAAALGYTGYLHALAYARERAQGRLPGAKDPAQPQVPIIEHADVRRMLLAQKAAAEGALALCLLCARLVDERHNPDQAARDNAALLLEMLTPIAKAWPSEFCLEANSLAIQVHGGYGYTREFPVEQFYRDNRLNPIHEGTNGIQGIDLLGRKAGMQDGAAIQLLAGEIHATIREASRCQSDELQECGKSLLEALDRIMDVTRDLLCVIDRGESEIALANSSVYLNLVGHTVIAWVWLRQALLAVEKLNAETPGDADFYQGKLQACTYFFRWELPRTRHWFELLHDRDATCLEMQSAWF